MRDAMTAIAIVIAMTALLIVITMTLPVMKMITMIVSIATMTSAIATSSPLLLLITESPIVYCYKHASLPFSFIPLFLPFSLLVSGLSLSSCSSSYTHLPFPLPYIPTVLVRSECVGRSGAKNERAREAGSINQVTPIALCFLRLFVAFSSPFFCYFRYFCFISLVILGRCPVPPTIVPTITHSNPIPSLYSDLFHARPLHHSLGGQPQPPTSYSLLPLIASRSPTLTFIILNQHLFSRVL